MIVAGVSAPCIGIFNDFLGIRINGVVSAVGLASVLILGAISNDLLSAGSQWYLILAQLFLIWQSTTITYACSHLFGIKCGVYCLSYVHTATAVAAILFIPLIFYNCFD